MSDKIDDGGQALVSTSLRDYFAAAALQGIIGGSSGRMPLDKITRDGAAQVAYQFADTMLAARELIHEWEGKSLALPITIDEEAFDKACEVFGMTYFNVDHKLIRLAIQEYLQHAGKKEGNI